MDENIDGLDLARLFYEEVVLPVISTEESALQFSAGVIGPGSEVIGCDDEYSRDHDWGPRCQLYLRPPDFAQKKDRLEFLLKHATPAVFRGWPTDMPGEKQSSICILNSEEVFNSLTGQPVGQWSPVDWLTIHEHHLLGVISGELFRDDLCLEDLRHTLRFYPDDLRLYLIAAEWIKISQEQSFPARSGMRGSEVGSVIIGARLAESAMRLWFYIHRHYPSYSKWFGMKFLDLPGAKTVSRDLNGMLTASTWQKRDEHWGDVLSQLLVLHEEHDLLTIGRYKPASVYKERPGTGIPAFGENGSSTIEELICEIRSAIKDKDVLTLPKAIGSVNQISSMTDVLDSRMRTRKLRPLYDE